MTPEGVIVPMFTPCTEEGQLDPEGIQGYVQYLESRAGISYIFVRSGVGRMYTFTCDETRLMMKEALSASASKPILPGTAGEYDGNPEAKPLAEEYTQQTIELSQEAHALGAPAVVIVLPSALPLKRRDSSEDVIFEYYKQIDEAVDIPILLYQPPGLPEPFQMTSPLMRRLSELDHVIGMKLSSADSSLWQELGSTARETGFSMICGNENGYLMALFHGAQGVIGEGCNLYPELLCALKYHFEMGDLDTAEVLQEKIQRMLGLKKKFPSSLIGKALAKYRGYNVQVALRPDPRKKQTGYDSKSDPAQSLPDEAFIAKYDEELRKACEPYLNIVVQ